MVAGSGTIEQSGNTLTVTQHSDKLATDWQSFSIGRGHRVDFVQPSASSVALNRVIGSDVSVIQGTLNANGQVFLINPNGVLFTSSAQVNTGGLVASTLNLSNEEFLGGDYRFSGESTAAVANQGEIRVNNGGTVALIAARIENTGTIEASGGNVLMGAGRTVTLDLGGPVKIEVEEGALEALIDQGGAIRADGGHIYLTARAADELSSAVINHTGITEAQTLVTGEQGEIYLMGDMAKGRVDVAGSLHADGGFVETSAATVKVADGTTVKAGHWLIDPNDFTIAAAGGDISGTMLSESLDDGHVTIESASGGTDGNGDIFVLDDVTWSSGNTLTLSAYRNIEILATLDASQGLGGKVVLAYGQGAADGVIGGQTARYGFGFDALGEATFQGRIDLQAGNRFSTKLGAGGATIDYTVVTDIDAVQAINGDLTGNYALGADVEYIWQAGTTFTPIGGHSAGEGPARFSGRFDGLGHAVDALSIELQGVRDRVGLFGSTQGAEIRNLTLAGADVSGLGSVGALIGHAANTTVTDVRIEDGNVNGSASHIGGLIGYGEQLSLDGVAINPFSHVNGNTSDGYIQGVGGLVGGLYSGTVGRAAVAAQVSVNSNGSASSIGGLVGEVYRNNAADTALITDSHATGAVTAEAASGADHVGGLVGNSQYGDISRSYATGEVSGDDDVGGLVGGAYGAESGGAILGSISQSYAGGKVTATGDRVGGLAGRTSVVISDVYVTGDVTGNEYVGGIAGMSEGGITRAWASGKVAGASNVGALVGRADGDATLTHSYYDLETTGGAGIAGCGSVGASASCSGLELYTHEALAKGSYTGFDFDNIWFMPLLDGLHRPLLRSEWSGTITNAHQLQLMAMDPAASYRLATDIDFDPYFSREGRANIWATGIDPGTGEIVGGGFAPVGHYVSIPYGFDGYLEIGTRFSGRFDAQGRTISELFIHDPQWRYGSDSGSLTFVGLFGTTTDTAVIENIGLEGGSVEGGAYASVGALVGLNGGTVRNAWAEVTVSSLGNYATVGGLVGRSTDGSSLLAVVAHGDVTASGDSVTSGGLVGANSGLIRDAYATGAVTQHGSGGASGGLVGMLGISPAVVEYAYAVGAVDCPGCDAVGGLIGMSGAVGSGFAPGTVHHSFWDASATGQDDGLGHSGGSTVFLASALSGEAMQDPFSFIVDGWDFEATWAKPVSPWDNGGRMVLRAQHDPADLYAAYVKVADGQNLTRSYGSTGTSVTGLAYTAESIGADKVLATWGSAVTPTADAGTTFNLADADVLDLSYDGAGSVYVADKGDGTLTIAKAPLTVTANDAAKTYDGQPWSGGNGVSYSGFVNGEDTSVLTGTLAWGGDAQGAVDPGSYMIIPSGLDGANYEITFVDGTLTISAAVVPDSEHGSGNGVSFDSAIASTRRGLSAGHGAAALLPDGGRLNARAGRERRTILPVRVASTGIRLPEGILFEEEEERR